MTHSIIKTDNYLLVVDDSEIKEGNIFFSKEGLIHTNIGWNYGDRVIIAHLPLNNSPVLQGVDLLPPLEDEVEKLAEEFKSSYKKVGVTDYEASSFIVGYNKAKEKYKYTEEDVINAYRNGVQSRYSRTGEAVLEHTFIQSLNLPKMPNAFECEMDLMYQSESLASASGFSLDTKDIYTTKITTTSDGLTQWVGRYIN